MSARGKVKSAAIEESAKAAKPRQFSQRNVSDDESRYSNELRSFITQDYAHVLGLRGTMGFDSFGGGSSDPTTRASPAMNDRAHEKIVSMRRVAAVWIGVDSTGEYWLSDEDRAYAKEHHWVYPAGYIEGIFDPDWLNKTNEHRLYAQAMVATSQALALGRQLVLSGKEAEWMARESAKEVADAAWLKGIADDERHWWGMVVRGERHIAAPSELAAFIRKWEREPTADEIRYALRLAVKRSRGAGKGKGSSDARTAIQAAFTQAKKGVGTMYVHFARGRRGEDRQEIQAEVDSFKQRMGVL